MYKNFLCGENALPSVAIGRLPGWDAPAQLCFWGPELPKMSPLTLGSFGCMIVNEVQVGLFFSAMSASTTLEVDFLGKLSHSVATLYAGMALLWEPSSEAGSRYMCSFRGTCLQAASWPPPSMFPAVVPTSPLSVQETQHGRLMTSCGT
jgi:hypothetical protein